MVQAGVIEEPAVRVVPPACDSSIRPQIECSSAVTLLLLCCQLLANLVILLIIELDVPIISKPAFPQILSFLPQDILNRDALVGEDFEMIGNQMAILTPRTGNQSCAEMVGLFGDTVGGAVEAFAARKCLFESVSLRLESVTVGEQRSIPIRKRVLQLFEPRFRLPLLMHRLTLSRCRDL